MKTIKELTESAVKFAFRGRDKQPVAPAGEITYYLQDVATGIKLVEAGIPNGDSEVEIVISANDNRCLTEGSKTEERILVIQVEGFAKDSVRFNVERVG